MIAFLIITALILLNGLFVAAEFAIVGAPRAAIDRRAADGHMLARAVQAVLRDPRKQDRYIATAQLGITVTSLGLGMYGEHVVAEALYQLLGDSGLPAWLTSHALASFAAIAVLTYFHIVVGEMAPKSIALQRAEQMVLWITPPMLWTKNILFPFVWALNGLGNLVLRIIGVNRQVPHAEQYYTPEELQMIVQESEELGAIRAESGQMLQELFEFGDLTAGEVMVPRVRIVGIPVGATAQELRALLPKAPHTRYPVYQNDLDHIVGAIHVKEVLRVIEHGEPIREEHARPVPIVPETAPLDTVLSTMQREKAHMVLVIDEHGGTSGVVTLEDLFEEVVGEIDEGPASAPPVYRDERGRVRVRGTMRVDEVGQEFDLELEHQDVDSVSGLILMLLGRPPRLGDTVRFGRLEFEVTKVKGRGVDEAAVTLVDAPPEDE